MRILAGDRVRGRSLNNDFISLNLAEEQTRRINLSMP